MRKLISIVLGIFTAAAFITSCSSNSDDEKGGGTVFQLDSLSSDEGMDVVSPAEDGWLSCGFLKPDTIFEKDTTIEFGYDAMTKKETYKIIRNESIANLEIISTTNYKGERFKDQKKYVLVFQEGTYEHHQVPWYSNNIVVKADGVYMDGDKKISLNNFRRYIYISSPGYYTKDNVEKFNFSAQGTINETGDFVYIDKDDYSFRCTFTDAGAKLEQLKPRYKVIGTLKRK